MTLPEARLRWPPLVLAGSCAAFLVAATMNAGGYRYGASDQAFYVPAVLHHLDPALYPRDWPLLLAPQDRFNVFTTAVAWCATLTGADTAHLFFALYLLGLVLLFFSAVALGARLCRLRWSVLALVAALTLRHAIALGAVNTLEGYMHPRIIAFGAGALAIGACLAAHPLAAALAGVAALIFHPSTGFWFALWVSVALIARAQPFARPRFRAAAFALLLLAGAVVAWAVLAGPLAGRFPRMDDSWLSVLRSKTYLFPSRWPLDGWLPGVLTALAAALIYRLRSLRGLVTREERGVAAGAALLCAGFLLSIPLTAARVSLVVQAQVPRVLWMVDLLGVTYLVWFLAEGPLKAGHDEVPAAGEAHAKLRRGARRARAVALVFVALSLGRGAYVMLVEHRDRPLIRVQPPESDWSRAMRWVALHTDKTTRVLAPPGHAWMYGSSVRVTGERDVYLEEAKDTAMAMYSRQAALEVLRRIRRVQGVEAMTVDQLRELGQREGLDVVVTERAVNLPLMHQDGRFRVYRLK